MGTQATTVRRADACVGLAGASVGKGPHPLLPRPADLDFSNRCLPSDALVPNSLRAGCWGIPWEEVIQASQATGKGVWVNAPVSATVSWPANTTSYVYEWATLMRDGNAATGGKGVPAGAPIYIEHSNEVRCLAVVQPPPPLVDLSDAAFDAAFSPLRSGITDLVSSGWVVPGCRCLTHPMLLLTPPLCLIGQYIWNKVSRLFERAACDGVS